MSHSTTIQPTTLTTAADALHDEEIGRTRAFLRTGWAVAIGVIAMTLLSPGNEHLREALLFGIGVAVLGSVAIYSQLRNPLRYDPRKITALALVCVGCGQLGILYVGDYSSAALIVQLGICFFCRTESTAAAVAIYVIAAGAHLLEVILVLTGVIDDPGFYPIHRGVPLAAQIGGHFVVQQGYATCFWLARLTRKANLASIEQLQEATRMAAQREAQVEELRQDLDRALKIGGPGRFTGQVVGSWELGAVLGRGAMGEVYEATRPGGNEAAVKLLRRELLSERNNVDRFLREVKIASSLDSAHAVKVLEASTPEDPLPFIAMERLRGQTLGDLLREGGITRPGVADFVQQIAGVLDQARDAGIVHRDLKPHNVFRTDQGVWKVLDFGVALLGEHSGTLTQGAIVGTPVYMAPEQAKGELVDHRADLYAFGAIIYRCLTGQLPFLAKDTPAMLYSVVHEMPLRPSSLSAISTDLEAWLLVALAKSRDARFQSGAELAATYPLAERGELPDDVRRRAVGLRRQHPWTERDEGGATQQLPRGGQARPAPHPARGGQARPAPHSGRRLR